MYAISVLCLFLTISSTQAANEWKIQAKYGETVTFNCTEPNAPKGAEPRFWMLPNLKIVNTSWVDTDKTRYMTNDGQLFVIKNITDKDFGLYHCLMEKVNGTGWFMIKRALNIDGPYFGNLWIKYRSNVTYGCIAMGSFLLFIVVVFTVYTFRWRPPAEIPTISIVEHRIIHMNGNGDGKDNPTFLYDPEDPVTKKSEMKSMYNGAANSIVNPVGPHADTKM